MNTNGPKILAYRWIVFLLALGYAIYYLSTSNYAEPLGPFRYLTIWALLCSVFVGWCLLMYSRGESKLRWDGFIGMTTVLNAMVVFLYWKLFFEDPNSVTRDGELGTWYLEFYLHLVGPLLQWIDALFLHRAFRKFKASCLWLIGIIALYLSWSELVVQPLNEKPAGSVTSGLPYPFLNDLPFSERLVFYSTNFIVALLLLCVFFAISWVLRRAPTKS